MQTNNNNKQNGMKMNNAPKNQGPTGIRRVSFYTAAPVETCDRCGTGIKYVSTVEFKDGTRKRFGSECINAVLSSDNSLRKLWNKNAKDLKHWLAVLEVLNRPLEKIPLGMPEVNSQFNERRFVGLTDGGQWIGFGANLNHPLADFETLFDGKQFGLIDGKYQVITREGWRKECLNQIEEHKKKISARISQLEAFLARTLQPMLKK